ncbi:MAG: diguanylate cyclase [Rhodocyclaceae bacterium]|nr:diguanylate cyclase [Rhodocyclaceae bacterium]
MDPSPSGSREMPVRASLGRRLLFWILLISGFNALAATSIQLYIEYRRDLTDLDGMLVFIRDSQLPSIAQAAWNFDDALLQTQLGGIADSPWIRALTIHYGPRESARLAVGDVQPDHARQHVFTLDYPSGTGVVRVGRLIVWPNMAEIRERTKARILVVLATQAVKVMVISFTLLWLVSWMITRHLGRIAAYARAFVPGHGLAPFALEREPERADELHDLVTSLNDAYRRLDESHAAELDRSARLESLVAERTGELQRLAHHDSLTGLPNRRLFADRLERAMAAVQRRGGQIALAYLDLDGFKAINDQCGHDAGDAVLKAVAARLQAVMREGDTLARMGGDEFVALLTDLSEDPQIEPLIERLLAAASEPVPLATCGLQVTASIGVALHPRDAHDAEALIRRADQAMYEAKLAGRNRWRIAGRSGRSGR